MHIQSHLMSGWCAANCFSLTARERFLAMLAATLPDLDGLSWFFGAKAYWATHHIYGHNLLFGIALSGFLSVFCTHRLKCFLLYLGLFHLHLGMDLLGSGDGWTIPYALPFSSHEYAFHGTWDFNGPENKLVGLALLIWCLGIAVVQRRTPLEYPMPKLDAQLVALGVKAVARMTVCGARLRRIRLLSLGCRYWWLPPVAFYAAELCHEAGHGLAALLTGGTIRQIDLMPWQLTQTVLTTNPHPGIVVWAGPLFGIALPLVIGRIWRRWKYAAMLRFFSGMALVVNGVYLGLGGFARIGDTLEMTRSGTPLWAMVIFGIAALISGVLLWCRSDH